MKDSLFHAAQAVMDATYKEMDYAPRCHVKCAAAAALRAVADQVVPQRRKPMHADSWEKSEWTAQQDTRAKLLAIADELEAGA